MQLFPRNTQLRSKSYIHNAIRNTMFLKILYHNFIIFSILYLHGFSQNYSHIRSGFPQARYTAYTPSLQRPWGCSHLNTFSKLKVKKDTPDSVSKSSATLLPQPHLCLHQKEKRGHKGNFYNNVWSPTTGCICPTIM